MTQAAIQQSRQNFVFSSSIEADVWSPKPNAKAYEWWYFDAVSDDGRDVVVIIFLDNFVFSPRYNKRVQSGRSEAPNLLTDNLAAAPQTLKSSSETKEIAPAVAFVYYRDGVPVYRSVNEFTANEFSADEQNPSCRIGESSFHTESAPYGSGYVITVKGKMRKNQSLEAHFEWVCIESDFLKAKKFDGNNAHVWNLVCSRADVSGRIVVKGEKERSSETVHFRGTGYHDHNYDNRWLPETVRDWQWGRAHFTDATAVFYRYREIGEPESSTKLFLIRDGKLQQYDADYEEQFWSRDIFGIKYPQRLRFTTDDNLRLRVKQLKLIDSSFFYLRFLSEMNLTFRDGKPRKSVGITEYLSPRALKYRWLDWLVSMRIGRNGKGSFLR